MTRSASRGGAAVFAALSAVVLMGGAADQAVPPGASPDPSGAGQAAGSAAPVAPTVAPTVAPAAAPEAKKSTGKDLAPATTAKKSSEKKDAAAGKTETLPWANKAVTAPSGTTTALGTQCLNINEAACRDLKKECAWVADVKQGDGSVLAAHCVGRRPPPPPKTTASVTKPKTEKAEKKAVAPAATTPAAAPAAGAAKPVAPPADPGIPEPQQP